MPWTWRNLRYPLVLIAAIALMFSSSFMMRERVDTPSWPEATPFWQCRRIVSMAPSITETLYALGLGDRVVGATRYCEYPPDAKNKVPVGGYYDPNFEAIVALRPDLVILLEEHEPLLPAFQRLKLETLTVSNQTVEGIIESFRTIGRVCGRGPEGRRMARQYEERLERIRQKTRLLPRPRVLIALDRTHGRGHLADVYVVGADRYFDRIIELAGGTNAYADRGVGYPVITPEGILWLNPDVIVDLLPKNLLDEVDRKSVVADWNELARVEAVKNRRVLLFDQDYASVPGPRFMYLVEDLARALHPKRKWDNRPPDKNDDEPPDLSTGALRPDK
jgi:iron complex transport system substrate-binding protein